MLTQPSLRPAIRESAAADFLVWCGNRNITVDAPHISTLIGNVPPFKSEVPPPAAWWESVPMFPANSTDPRMIRCNEILAAFYVHGPDDYELALLDELYSDIQRDFSEVEQDDFDPQVESYERFIC